jgi:non-specific serine/threonine protein kinase
MREMLRSYLAEASDAAGETDAVRAWHRDWCLALAEQVPPLPVAGDQVERLRSEEANLRAALHWTTESDQAAAASRLAIGLSPLWLTNGNFAEARVLLTATTQLLSSAASPATSSLAYSWAAVFAHNEGAYRVTEKLAAHGLALAEQARDENARVHALSQLGQALIGQADLVHAADYLEEALEHGTAGGPLGVIVSGLLAVIMMELDDLPRAEQLLGDAVNWARDAKFDYLEGRLLTRCALLAERVGDRWRAEALLTEALAVERKIGAPASLIEVLTTYGLFWSERGQRTQAVDALREALDLAASHGSHVRLARVLEAMSSLLVDTEPAPAVNLAAAGRKVRDSLGVVLLPSERNRLVKVLARARQRLGERAYLEAWSSIADQSIDAVLDQARTCMDRPVRTAQTSGDARTTVSSMPADPLSKREREVVVLVSRGLTNPEISDLLVVSRRTVESHIGHILTKLGLANRLQIARWAYEHDLLGVRATPAVEIE